ncbi:6-phospho-beta-glucosidase [Bacillus shivajii]|uniref:6-phospho-beta-glucosidase n=1 Tax=Bacillus shivajii TaxID=1983719 RepID=UPI001CFB0787|nr:6-phospho-beta-glucosidase [Bacillus shivajii]UCZ52806.1 6-phospho-beta-glucosidase [Bacillus shivajii]
MKLTLIGGAGVRVPLMVEGLIRWKGEVCIEELVLYDSNAEKLSIIGELVRHIVSNEGNPFQVKLTTELREAVQGADFIYTAIRSGGEKGRVIDERVALKHGVIGQETTGAGGFAMALRTIPAMLEIARVIEETAPEAWVINFTNPSGLITEALQKYTKLKMIGICDAPSSMKIGIAHYLKQKEEDVYINYFGLNHLGWVNKVLVNGTNQMLSILNNYDEFIEVYPHMKCFSNQLVTSLNLLPNEYLFYYYYQNQALLNMKNSTNTRGEQIVKLNRSLLEQLKENKGDMARSLCIYNEVMNERNSTYMTAETGSDENETLGEMESEGYEGLAMSILSSIFKNKKKELILNVKNNGVIPELEHEDVIEVTCLLDNNGPKPLAVGEVPSSVKGLLVTIKEYERLTIEAAVEGDIEKAVMALTIHPLVNSNTIARDVVNDYLAQHKEYLPQFGDLGEKANV